MCVAHEECSFFCLKKLLYENSRVCIRDLKFLKPASSRLVHK